MHSAELEHFRGIGMAGLVKAGELVYDVWCTKQFSPASPVDLIDRGVGLEIVHFGVIPAKLGPERLWKRHRLGPQLTNLQPSRHEL